MQTQQRIKGPKSEKSMYTET